MNRSLYLHGFASGPSSTKAVYFRDRLKEYGIAVDIPALDAGDFEHLTISNQLAVIERSAADISALIGSSLGGYLAAIYAARHPEVQRVVLLAPAFEFGRRWTDRIGPESLVKWRESGFLETYHYGENRSRRLSYDLLDDAEHYEDFPDFQQPALIFHGTNDDVVPARLSEQFAKNHPNVQLELLDSGHELHNVLDYMADRIGPFLACGQK